MKQLVSKAYIPDELLKPLEKIIFQKQVGKSNKLSIDKAEMKELIDLCPYLFKFPQISTNTTSNGTGV